MKRDGGGSFPLLCAVVVLGLSIASCGPPAGDGVDVAIEAAGPSSAVRSVEAVDDDGGVTHVVEIRQFEFVPDVVNARPGDRIVWKNLDVVPHTATEASRAWDSGNLGKDAEWTMVAGAPGTIDYICAYHLSMKGKVVISE